MTTSLFNASSQTVTVTLIRIVTGVIDPGYPVTNQPLLFVAVGAIISGTVVVLVTPLDIGIQQVVTSYV